MSGVTIRAEQVGKRIWLGPWRRYDPAHDLWCRDEIVSEHRWRAFLNVGPRRLDLERPLVAAGR